MVCFVYYFGGGYVEYDVEYCGGDFLDCVELFVEWRDVLFRFCGYVDVYCFVEWL